MPSVDPVLMTVGEVAELFFVNVKTVARWAETGKVTCIRTPGGHRRFVRHEIELMREVATTEKNQP